MSTSLDSNWERPHIAFAAQIGALFVMSGHWNHCGRGPVPNAHASRSAGVCFIARARSAVVTITAPAPSTGRSQSSSRTGSEMYREAR